MTNKLDEIMQMIHAADRAAEWRFMQVGPLGRYLALEHSITPALRGEEVGMQWVRTQWEIADDFDPAHAEERYRKPVKRLVAAPFPAAGSGYDALVALFRIAYDSPSHDPRTVELGEFICMLGIDDYEDEERAEVLRNIPLEFVNGFWTGVKEGYDEFDDAG
ncbi:hypothetical protein [Phyllobacterium sp. P5_D12]